MRRLIGAQPRAPYPVQASDQLHFSRPYRSVPCTPSLFFPPCRHDSYPRGVPNVPPGVAVEPWTGWTVWNATLPSPSALIAHMRARGVRVLFNLHPHFGVQFYDAV